MFWLSELPLPALVTLIIALACVAVTFLFLIAFVPHMTERIVTIIKAVRANYAEKDKE
jgi:hypothetical protein